VFENGSTKGRSLDSIKRSDCHVTRCRKEESDKRWNNKVNLPGIESYNGALMIGLVGIVVQPHVQGRGYRHCKNSKLPNDKKCQECCRLVSSVH
jgi:hypothetical protein